MFSKLLIATLAVACSASSLDEQFAQWMATHHRHYSSDEEFNVRKSIFAQTIARNEKLRALEPEATFGLNKFADLTPEEFKHMFMGRREGLIDRRGFPTSRRLDLDEAEAAQSFDWRTTKPYPVTAVKDQGQCGSCWAFSTTEGVESAWIMQGEQQALLAPQEIVSCDTVDLGCNGGDLPSAFTFVESLATPKDVGLTESHKYPYTSGTTGVTGACKKKRERNGETPVQKAAFAIEPCSTLDSANANCNAQSKEEPQLAAQLMAHGPISICVDASPWQTYTGGILKSEAQCPGGAMDLDHCVQLVGFDKTGPTPYWIVRNSWNTDWGEKGFIYLEMGKNMCGVADEPMFATDKTSVFEPAPEIMEFVGEMAPLSSPHYEDPNTTGKCQSGEMAVQIQGVSGKMCAPKCAFLTKKCPTDVPAGVTAKPTCALQGMGGKYCALICSPSDDVKSLRAGDAQCGTNASCKAVSGTGICTYDK